MKKSRIIAVIFCVTVLFGLNISFADAEAYNTLAYNVQLDLYENNSFVVTEDISVNLRNRSMGFSGISHIKGRRRDR